MDAEDIWYRYYYARTIEAIRALAADFEDQLLTIPKEIHYYLAHELFEDIDIWFVGHREGLLRKKMISVSNEGKIDELISMLDRIEERDYSLESLRESNLWEEIRDKSKEILISMGEEIRPPKRGEDLTIRGLINMDPPD